MRSWGKVECFHTLEISLWRYLLISKGETVTWQRRNPEDTILTKRAELASPVIRTCQHRMHLGRMHRRVHHFWDLTQNLSLNLIMRKYQEHLELRDRIQITVQHLFMKGKERLRNLTDWERLRSCNNQMSYAEDSGSDPEAEKGY